MSERRFITQGKGLPRWSNPISHAVVVGKTCYVSGQLSVNKGGQYLPGSALEEASLAFANFFAALAAAGFTREEVVFVDIAFSNLDDLQYGERPARTVYRAAALTFGGKVNVTGTAMED